MHAQDVKGNQIIGEEVKRNGINAYAYIGTRNVHMMWPK